jgi:hypothetical protein
MFMRYLTITCFLFILTIASLAQNPSDTIIWRIETVDGNEFVGKIIQKDAQSITIASTIYGEINLLSTYIKQMEPVNEAQLKNNELWTENPQSTRYFWAPNGYGLRKQEGYFQNTWVLFNQASYGFSDHISVGLGMIPLFLFAGTPTPIWITPKFSIPLVKDVINVGGGVLVGTLIGETSDPVGLAYGVATAGNRDANITFGMGYGFVGSDFGETPVFTLSGMVRVSRKGYLLTENYLISAEGESFTLLSLGGRTVWPKVSVDYGLLIPIISEMDGLIALPWLSFVVPFGK